jgi:Tfp pilus assembly protein PilV
MKKLLVALTALICMATTTNAQNKNASKQAKAATAAVKPAAAKQAGPMKKDGTPDKRFKANKEAAGTMKKDGTPDMRYKANKKKS